MAKGQHTQGQQSDTGTTDRRYRDNRRQTQVQKATNTGQGGNRQQTSSGQQQDIRPSIPQPGAMGPLPADQRGQDDYYLNLATIAQRQAAEALQLMGDEQRQQFQKVQQQGAEMQLQLQGAVGGQPTARQHPTPRNG